MYTPPTGSPSGKGFTALYSDGDNRYNLHEKNIPFHIREQAKAVACLIDKEDFKKLTTNPSDLPKQEQGKSKGEPIIGVGTAFLVAPSLVLTAAHCITNENTKQLDYDKISRMRLIFNLCLDSSGKPLFDKNEVYRFRHDGILWAQDQSQDWALIELNKEVEGVKRIKISYKDVASGEEVYMLGHPEGMALKYTNNATIKELSSQSFAANLDAFAGNSGSPVFNKNGKAIGILIQGNKDYNEDGSLYHVKSGEGFETCQKINQIEKTARKQIKLANHPKEIRAESYYRMNNNSLPIEKNSIPHSKTTNTNQNHFASRPTNQPYNYPLPLQNNRTHSNRSFEQAQVKSSRNTHSQREEDSFCSINPCTIS